MSQAIKVVPDFIGPTIEKLESTITSLRAFKEAELVRQRELDEAKVKIKDLESKYNYIDNLRKQDRVLYDVTLKNLEKLKDEHSTELLSLKKIHSADKDVWIAEKAVLEMEHHNEVAELKDLVAGLTAQVNYYKSPFLARLKSFFYGINE